MIKIEIIFDDVTSHKKAMFRIPQSYFLRYIETTYEPIYLELYIDPKKEIFDETHLNTIFETINKNKNSTELIITNCEHLYVGAINFNNFIQKFRVPLNITTIELPIIYYDEYDKLRIILQPHIVNLKLHSVNDLFNIDYSENTDLQTIKIVSAHNQDLIKHMSKINDQTIKKYRGDNSNCFAHLYNLKQICFLDCKDCKNNIIQVMKYDKLPHDCKVVFLDD